MKALTLIVFGAFAMNAQAGPKLNLPDLDRAAVKAEAKWQRDVDPEDVYVSADWNWMEMTQADLIRHALPVLTANVELCPDDVVTLPVDGENVEACGFIPYYDQVNPYPNAYTDGSYIWITGGMVRAIRNADEYRSIVAHEIGHVLADHIKKKRRRAWIGAAVGALAGAYAGGAADQVHDMAALGASFGAMAFSKKMELEADYIGGYMLARSGGSIKTASDMWRRFGDGGKGSFLGSHPSSAQRFVLMRDIAAEYKAKQDNGQPLLPNVK